VAEFPPAPPLPLPLLLLLPRLVMVDDILFGLGMGGGGWRLAAGLCYLFDEIIDAPIRCQLSLSLNSSLCALL